MKPAYLPVYYTCGRCDALAYQGDKHHCQPARTPQPAHGWRCPSCRTVWGPLVERCKVCNRSEINL